VFAQTTWLTFTFCSLLALATHWLQMVGGKIAQLEARKRLAVEREDYDLAKALKADIEKLRVAGEAAAGVGAGGASPGKDIRGCSSSRS
jgi:centrosomal protein CEP104